MCVYLCKRLGYVEGTQGETCTSDNFCLAMDVLLIKNPLCLVIQQLKPHTHTEKQTATSVAFWCILMALSQRSDARCRQYSAVATLKVWSRDL